MCASIVNLHQRHYHLPRAPPVRPASTRRPPHGSPCIGSLHKKVTALLAFALHALVLADARAPALLAAGLLADARATALLACSPHALVLTDARPPALLALAPYAPVRTGTAHESASQRLRRLPTPASAGSKDTARSSPATAAALALALIAQFGRTEVSILKEFDSSSSQFVSAQDQVGTCPAANTPPHGTGEWRVL